MNRVNRGWHFGLRLYILGTQLSHKSILSINASIIVMNYNNEILLPLLQAYKMQVVIKLIAG